MTVNEFKNLLEKAINQGHGEKKIYSYSASGVYALVSDIALTFFCNEEKILIITEKE